MPDHSLTNAEQKARWLLERRTMLTGTDAAKVLALSADRATAAELTRFGGPMDVYLDKIGEAPERGDSGPMRAGRYLERPILDMYAEQDPEHVIPIVYDPPFTERRSLVHDFIGAQIDAMRVDENAPVDAKNLRRLDQAKWGVPGSDQIPIYYACQLAMQMHVTDAAYADLAVLVSGQDLLVFRLHRDLQTEADIIARLSDFWRYHVLAHVPPPVDASSSWTEHLARMFTKASEAIIPATPELHAAAERYLDAKGKIEELDLIKTGAENVLKNAIGENRGILGRGWKALWSPTKDTVGTNWEAVARALAEEVSVGLGREHVPQDSIPTPDEVLAAHAKHHQIITRKGSRRFTFQVKE